MCGLTRRKKSEDGHPLKKADGLEIWLTRRMDKVDRFKAKVALINKLARIAWEILAKREQSKAPYLPRAFRTGFYGALDKHSQARLFSGIA